MGQSVRAQAARAVAEVLSQGRSLSQVLPRFQAQSEQGPLLAELVYGALRWRFHDEALLGAMLRAPLKRADLDLHALLLIGLHQLQRMRVPPHAVVSETVAATGALGKKWARGLVNALLRRFQREHEALLKRVESDRAVRLAYPPWLASAICADWPDACESVMAAGNQHPPLSLRVNRAKGSRTAMRQELAQTGIIAQPHAYAEDALVLEQAVDVEALPGFSDGRLSVQDVAAQFAADLLDLQAGQRVLDACAAPGGKACHALEREPDIAELVALDNVPQRLARVGDNLARLDLKATLVDGDAAEPAAWWDGQAFDRILLDAPCSATGVIRRHPDIKSLRRVADIDSLNAQQQRLLAALWPLLAPGGRLVYCTCSVLRKENETVVSGFLEANPDARPVFPEVPWGRPAGPGRQILPGDDGMDGFYYACVVKTT